MLRYSLLLDSDCEGVFAGEQGKLLKKSLWVDPAGQKPNKIHTEQSVKLDAGNKEIPRMNIDATCRLAIEFGDIMLTDIQLLCSRATQLSSTIAVS